MGDLQVFFKELSNEMVQYEDVIFNIVYSLAIIVLFYVLIKIVTAILYKKNKDIQRKYKLKKITTSSLNVIMIILLMFVWYDSFTYIITFIGLFTAGLAIALREPLMNIAGGIYILSTNPFKVGDRVEIGHHKGDVVDIKLFQFTLLEVGNRINSEQSTGRMIHMPNMLIFSQPLMNYEKGFKYIWSELGVTISLNSDWQLAKEILLDIANVHSEACIDHAEAQIKEAGKKYLIYYSNLSPIIYTKMDEGKILLTIRYLCEPRKVRNMEQLIWEDILVQFGDSEKITLI